MRKLELETPFINVKEENFTIWTLWVFIKKKQNKTKRKQLLSPAEWSVTVVTLAY